jgi:hypothetical protein
MHPRPAEALYFAGKSLGSRLVRGHNGTPEKAMILAGDVLKKAGLGRISKVRVFNDKLIVTCKPLRFGRGHGKLIAGVMAGVVTEAGDCNCAGREIGNQARNFELHILNR